MSKKVKIEIFAGAVAMLGIIGGIFIGFSFLKYQEIKGTFNKILELNFNFSNDAINIIVFAIIFLSTVISFAYLFFGKNRKNRKDISEVVKVLNKFLIENNDENSQNFNKFNKTQECVLQIEDAVKKMENNSKTKQLWGAYKSSFVAYNCIEKGNIIHHTLDAEYFFNEETLLKEEIRFKFYNYLPQFFLGIGIFGTFLGLALGLQGLDLTASSSAVIKESVKNLLKGVEVSFYTSVFGIYFSLLSSLVINIFFDDYGKNILEIKNGLNEIFIRDKNEEILFDLKSQLIQIKLSNDELAHRLANELGEKLGTLTESMSVVMNKFNQEVSGNLQKSVSDALEKVFSEGLVENFGQLTDRLTNNLERNNNQTEQFHGVMEEILGQFNTTKNSFKEISDKNNSIQLENQNRLREINEGAARSFGEIMSVSAEKVKSNFEVVNENIGKTTQEILGQFDTARNNLKELTEENHNIQLENQNRLKEMNEEAAKSFGEIMSVSAEKVKSNFEVVNENIGKTTQEILGQFDTTKNNLKEISEENYNIQLENQNRLREMNEEAAKSFGEIISVSSEKIRENFEKTTENIKNTAHEINDKFNQTSENIRGTAEISSKIFETIKETNNEVFSLAKEVKEIFMQKESFENISDIFGKVEEITSVLQKKMDSELELKEMWNSFGNEFRETNRNLVDSFKSYREEVSRGTLEFREIIKDLNQNYEQTLVKQTEKYSATVCSGTAGLFQEYDKNLTGVVGKFHGVLQVLNEKLGTLEIIMKENREGLDNYIAKVEKLNNGARQEKK